MLQEAPRRSPRPRPRPPRPWLAALAASAAVLALVGMMLIWAARLGTDRVVYVSGLGAPSMPTAPAFNAALLVLGIGGALAALAWRGRRSDMRWLRATTVATSLAVAGAAFVVASRVTCTDGCPIPLTAGSTAQDLVHVAAAVVGFASAALAMLQVATAPGRRATRLGAGLAASATGACAATGAALSLLGVRTDVGALLEFVAMTVAVLWLAIATLATAAGIVRRRALPR